MKLPMMSGRFLDFFADNHFGIGRRWYERVPFVGNRWFRRRLTALLRAQPGSAEWMRLMGERPAGVR